MFISPAYAQATGGAGVDIFGQLILLVPMFAIFYFLLIRPQQQRAKAHRELVAAVKRGDQVILSSGMLGKVTKAREGEPEVEVDIGSGSAVVVKVLRATISDIRNKTEAAKDA